ncbi:PQQ-dependent sugar dehydrogenase [Mucilaginibacter antarcticus]|uniref:PQQ-dependent sugar dehydrogenase n=1 Tax=Mucilaginibacter antarcticus TaxID=1855725 RepID=A0ABW5XQG5_9SPHI
MFNKKRIIKISAILLPVIAAASYAFMADVPKKPDESRFTPVTLTRPGDLDEPNTFEVLTDGRVLISERKGAIKLFDPLTKMVKTIATISVNTKYTSKTGKVTEAEEGLMGLTIDPDFNKTHFIYTFYAPLTEKKWKLTRWKFENEALVAGSEKTLLEFDTQRETCCHTGGGMTWDPKKNLYLTIGNNTASLLSPSTDERPGQESRDDQRGTSNTNSLLGKILRIHPEANGTYTIPAGNLFAKGTPKTRPEIFTMGHRNPWRVSVDTKTGYLYWGDVGPDATEDSEVSPMGYDELNQARKAGNFGWPYFVGPNVPAPPFNYVDGEPGAKKDPLKPTNESVNNTGLKDLPAVAPAFIYYPYTNSAQFPLLGSGSRSAVGGPIYHRTDRPLAKRPWPAYYEGKWLATDLARGWIMSISMKPNGDYTAMEQFLSSYHPIEPIDIKFGPDGDLYVLEYGSVWFGKSDNAKLVRIEYNPGNRKPSVFATTNKQGGTVPLNITLSSAGTKDADGDALKYSWKVTAPGAAPKAYATANPAITLTKAGVYMATLTVTDAKGASNSKSVKIIAGNEAPEVNIDLTGNRSFFFADKPLNYNVAVADKEDGSTTAGTIPAAQVSMSVNYASEGFDYVQVAQEQSSVDASTQFAVARAIMATSDCKNCHSVDAVNIAPSFVDIATKYKGNEKEIARLPSAIHNGSSGRWNKPIAMPAHPGISLNDAQTIVNYIMNVTNNNINTMPVKGTITPKVSAEDANGTYIIRAAYTDKGAGSIPKQTSTTTIFLKNPTVLAATATIQKSVTTKVGGLDGVTYIIPRKDGYIGFKKLDLTGIKQLQLAAYATTLENTPGGTIEVRLDSPTGALLGQAEYEQLDLKPKTQNWVKAELKETTGLHDLYFVFKNEKAKASDALLLFNAIKFEQ